MPHHVASDMGLHCLPVTLLRVSRQKWVNATQQLVNTHVAKKASLKLGFVISCNSTK